MYAQSLGSAMRCLLATSALLAFGVSLFAQSESGTISFMADDSTAEVPELFRLQKHQFDFQLTLKHNLKHADVEIYTLTFPSPVKTEHESNNTVHAEFFRPKNAKGRPATIVLDILDGTQIVGRSEALWLAQQNIPALVVHMAYYGPRRPSGTKLRLLTPDVAQSVANIRQTVLDCRRAFAWLETRPEVDPDKMALLGTSLGSLVGGVVGGVEPKVKSVCLLLGGGGLVDSFSEHRNAGTVLTGLAAVGITKETLKKQINPVDPLTYAARLKVKRLLLIAASRDDIVPPGAMKRLWEATDKPKLIWIDETHIGAALHMFQMMRAVVTHLDQ
jgi:dienelactone hydrolase